MRADYVELGRLRCVDRLCVYINCQDENERGLSLVPPPRERRPALLALSMTIGDFSDIDGT